MPPIQNTDRGYETILGYLFQNESLSGYTESLASWIERGTSCHWLACINPHSYALSLKDPEFAQALRDANWRIPDGIGIILASHIQRGILRQRITGYDIFTALHERLSRTLGARVFFLGSTEATLTVIRDKMTRDYPNIHVVGAYSPPFKACFDAAENDEMVRIINEARPDVVWVGMTAPKQEKWIHQNIYRLNAKFVGAIGAVFDFYSGRVKRSNPLFQKIGLEWLPRLLREPRRLWKRMFISAPIFIWHLLGSVITSHLNSTDHDYHSAKHHSS